MLGVDVAFGQILGFLNETNAPHEPEAALATVRQRVSGVAQSHRGTPSGANGAITQFEAVELVLLRF